MNINAADSDDIITRSAILNSWNMFLPKLICGYIFICYLKANFLMEFLSLVNVSGSTNLSQSKSKSNVQFQSPIKSQSQESKSQQPDIQLSSNFHSRLTWPRQDLNNQDKLLQVKVRHFDSNKK